MFRSRVSAKKFTAILTLLLVALIGVTINVSPSAQADIIQPAQVATSPNPAWPNKCGIKLGLLVDRSNSISTSEGNQLKTAAKGFVDALAGTPSQIAVAQFRKTASQTIGFTSVTNPAGATTVKNTIDGYGFGTNDNDGSTNWDAAFQSQKNLGADVVVILTDGNPTSRNIDGSGGSGSSDPFGYNLDAGITSANEVKANGARIVAVGIGNDVDTSNLQAISGPTNNSDYFTSSFDTLNAKLIEIAQQLCGGTVTVQKLVKNSDGSYTPTNGWDYTATNAVDNTQTTANAGTAEFKFENAPKNTVITETLKAGYALESIECKKNNVATGTQSGLGVSLTINTNDIISCTFKNAPTQGTVTVEKLIKNDDGSYTPANGWDYTATGAVDTTKTTSGNGSAVFSYVNTPKSSTITETVKTGYSVESVECKNSNNQVVGSSANASIDVTVPTNDAISCIFKNTRDKGTIRVVKNSVGGNGLFSFTSNTTLSNFDLTTVGGTAQTSAASIPTGNYAISEVVPTGWSLTGASCTGATPSVQGSTVSITVAKNANVVCTFTNTRDTATLRVVKNASGGNRAFSFTSDTPLGDFDLTTVGGTAQTSSVSINTGTYDITEVVPVGWSLTSLSCTNTTTTVDGSKITINATKDANIVCTFNNARDTATLRIVKNSSGANGTFGFTSDTPLGDFDLTTVGGTAQTSSVSINTGTYEISESSVTGWTLDAASCSGASFVKDGSKLTVTATKGANIVCTFGNSRDTGSLIVKKIATGGNNTFSFTSNTSLGDFDLTTVGGTAQTQKVTLPTGNYNLGETVPTGWTLVSSGCEVVNFQVVPGFIQPGTFINGVSIGKDQDVECTFTNARDTASIQVVKEATGGNGAFGFTSDTPLGDFDLTTVGGTAQTSSVSINTGTYEISESSVTGWTLDDVSCSGASFVKDGSKLTVTATKGANIVCTFENSRDTASIQVVKEATGGNGTFGFTSDTPLGDFDLTAVGGTAQTSSVSINTGEYVIEESGLTGWTLDAASCSGASFVKDGSKLTVTATKGANIVCTFENSRDTASIQVVKEASGGDDTFGFTSDTPLGDFDLTTVGGTAQTSSVSINTGEYVIEESGLTGWTLDAASCSGASFVKDGSKLSVTATKGANIVCTFENSRDTASIQIVKEATGGNGAFGFTSDTPLGDFDLTTVGGTAQTSSVSINTGTYEISESSVTGWTLDDVSCSGASFVKDGSKLTVTATKGANIVCTFENSRDTASIQVVKEASGGDDTFGFTSDTPLGDFDLTTVGGTAQTSSVSINTGEYVIEESGLTGWTLDAASCSGASFVKDGSKLTVTATKDANIVCTFENSRDTGSLTIQKFAIGDDGTFQFESKSPLGDFELETFLGVASTEKTAFDTGAYDFAEIVPENWKLTEISCSNESEIRNGDSVTISIGKDEDVVCAFTNTRDTATLQIVVIANGGENTFPFETDTSFGNFDLTTAGGQASTDVQTQNTGEYNLEELVPTGWTLDSLSCEVIEEQEDIEDLPIEVALVVDDEVNPLVIELQDGDNVVCTFVNSLDPIVLGTVVTRPADVQVKGISATNLPSTGSNSSGLVACSLMLIAGGALALTMSRKRKSLLG